MSMGEFKLLCQCTVPFTMSRYLTLTRIVSEAIARSEVLSVDNLTNLGKWSHTSDPYAIRADHIQPQYKYVTVYK